MAKKFGADIGYQTVRIVIPGEEPIYRSEPAVIAVSVADSTVAACGEDAIKLADRVPGSVKLIRPFSGQMTPEPTYITAYFSYIIKRLHMKGADLVLSLSGAHDDETETLFVRSAQKAGVGEVIVLDAVYAAAQGCGVKNVGESALVNIGASVTDMGCFQRANQVAGKSCPFAGNAFDRAIITQTVKNHRYRLTPEEAERIKLAIGTMSPAGGRTYEAFGMRPYGLPKKLTLGEEEISASFEGVFDSLADEIIAMIRTLKAEPDKVILTGGGAKLSSLATSLAPLLCLPVEVAKEPENAVIRGVCLIAERLK